MAQASASVPRRRGVACWIYVGGSAGNDAGVRCIFGGMVGKRIDPSRLRYYSRCVASWPKRVTSFQGHRLFALSSISNLPTPLVGERDDGDACSSRQLAWTRRTFRRRQHLAYCGESDYSCGPRPAKGGEQIYESLPRGLPWSFWRRFQVSCPKVPLCSWLLFPPCSTGLRMFGS